MDFAERIKRSAQRLVGFRPGRLAPTASIRLDLEAGAWSAGEPLARLANLCSACLVALQRDPLPAAAYDGHKGLRADAGAGLRVGIDGGRGWVAVKTGPADAVRAALAQAASAPEPGAGLEVLDLSTLDVADWRGALASPLVARLVLLAQEWVPAADSTRQVFGLAMDYDQRVLDAVQAVTFLRAVETALGRDDG